ncbi:MAG: glycoside hydrolase family 97 catalytic domain-containing protein [Bacteroidaceae bacterium]|nr:glycoside hydrolase family 97 catalytic domain-containing protein [Bacteroidaceae bacterium]
MKKILLLFFTLQLSFCASQAQSLSSPDGSYLFSFSQVDSRLRYSIDFKSQTIISNGELGVDIDNHLVESAMGIPVYSSEVWTEGLRLTGIDHQQCDTEWHPIYGERSAVRDHYNEMTLHFVKGSDGGQLRDGYNKSKNYLMDIIVRAYDEGIALRYHFPEATNGLFLHITNERTTFPFAPHTMGWHETWAQGPYQLLPLKDWHDECERPLLLSLPNGLSVALLEAGLVDYPRGKFALAAENTVQVSLFDSADVITAYDTPWRVVMAAERAVDLINHKDLILNLNDPCSLDDVQWIRPGKAFRCCRLDRATIMQSIDFAAEFGFEYVELDAGWYGPEMKASSDATKVADNRDFTMPDICQYARSKGIGIWLYVNQRALYYQLDEILPLYKQWGISGIKFGFVQIGSQRWTTWLHQAVRRCADYGLMVDIHDEYRPTGVSRTLPNLMTQEGIRGNEEMPDATHNTLLPFTRFLCGPGDYTLCYFNSRVKNTKAHQLAMAAVYYSPIQFMFWYDDPFPKGWESPELKFWRDCPTVFDESIALDGRPGEYIIQARRAADEWFVGAMTNTEARTVTIPTDFLPKGKYEVEIYNDDPTLSTQTKVSAKTVKVKAGKPITLPLQPSGGAALHFSPIK